ncbi:MAG: nucleotidyltransferase substrate binding protein [Ginsengibacter sp.]
MAEQDKDIRWIQRCRNFNKAFSQLKKFIEKKELNELEEQGLIKSFEYTYELAWNTLKDFFEYQGNNEINGSRDAINLAFSRGIIKDGEGWMNMFKDRNRTSHTYNETTAKEISNNIFKSYFGLFTLLSTEFEDLLSRDNTQLF